MKNKGLAPFVDLARSSLLMLELTRNLIHLVKCWYVRPSLGVHIGSLVFLSPWG